MRDASRMEDVTVGMTGPKRSCPDVPV